MIVYAPDCSCDLIERGFAFPGLKICYVTNEREARAALVECKFEFERAWLHERPAHERYHSVHGPGGHVLAVR